jgi:hypothetical protein
MRFERLSRLFLFSLSLSLLVYNRPALGGSACDVFAALDDLLKEEADIDLLKSEEINLSMPQFNLQNDERLLSLTRDFDAFDLKRNDLQERLKTEQSASLTNPAEIERLERELFNLVSPGFRFDLPHGKDCTLQFNIAIEDIRVATTFKGEVTARDSGVGRNGSEFFKLVGENAAGARLKGTAGFGASAGGLLRKIKSLLRFNVTGTSAFCTTVPLPQGEEIEFFKEFFSTKTGRERVSLFMTLSGTVRCCCFGAPSLDTGAQESPTGGAPSPGEEPLLTEDERPTTQDVVPPQTMTEIPSTPVQCRVAAASDLSLPSTISSSLSFLTLASGKLSFDSAGGINLITETTFVKTPSIDEAHTLRVQFQLSNLQGPETRIDAAGRKTATSGTANVTLNLAALDSGGRNIAFAQKTIPTRLSIPTDPSSQRILSEGFFFFSPLSTMTGGVAVKSDGITLDFRLGLPTNARVVSLIFTEDSSFTAKEFSAGVCDLPGIQTP